MKRSPSLTQCTYISFFAIAMVFVATVQSNGSESLIKHLLKNKGNWLNIDLAEARRLLARGADPNEVDGKTGVTPLIYAVLSWDSKSPKLVEQLLQCGADPNFRTTKSAKLEEYSGFHTQKGGTALTHAVLNAVRSEQGREKSCNIIRLLVKRGADADICLSTSPARTPLTLSIEMEAFDIAAALLQAGKVDPNFTCRKHGNSALTWAVLKGQSALVGMLLDLGSNPNANCLTINVTEG